MDHEGDIWGCTVGDMLWVEAAPEGLGCAPLCADQDVVVRLVPVVVAELQGFDLPLTLHDERLSVQQHKPAYNHQSFPLIRTQILVSKH